jgi:molybdopterin synthase sulfur carrier subunit
MSITVRYFASLREFLEKSEDHLPFQSSLTVSDVWKQLNPEKSLPNKTLVAINMEYAQVTDEVKQEDEVAFFPPVTGGADDH